MLQMRKVKEHVCEKMITNQTEDQGNTTTQAQEPTANHKATMSLDERDQYPADKVELYCNGQKLDDILDLRTVKYFIWKSGGDLVLHYMPVK